MAAPHRLFGRTVEELLEDERAGHPAAFRTADLRERLLDFVLVEEGAHVDMLAALFGVTARTFRRWREFDYQTFLDKDTRHKELKTRSKKKLAALIEATPEFANEEDVAAAREELKEELKLLSGFRKFLGTCVLGFLDQFAERTTVEEDGQRNLHTLRLARVERLAEAQLERTVSRVKEALCHAQYGGAPRISFGGGRPFDLGALMDRHAPDGASTRTPPTRREEART